MEAGSLRSGHQHGGDLVGALFQAADYCLLVVSSHGKDGIRGSLL